MPYTRTQANALLTQAEMKLFDESRANAVRKLDGKALAGRVERTRKLRDKARDQLQRQKLASRSRTGSKRGTSGDANRRSKDKAELLADILKRFEAQAKAAGKQARAEAAGRRSTTQPGGMKTAGGKATARKAATKEAATKKAATKKAATKKAATKKAATKKAPAKKAATKKAAPRKAAPRKAAPRKAATRKAATRKAATKKAATKKAAPRKAPAKQAATKQAATKQAATKQAATKQAATKQAATKQAAKGRPVAGGGAGTGVGKPARRARKGPISPEQALANTRALLEAKKRHDREGAAWQHIDGAASPAAGPYQSPEARSRAEELHAGESRMTAIEGSISTRGRKNQAKRDKR